MKIKFTISLTLLLLFSAATALYADQHAKNEAEVKDNTLTDTEKQAGWVRMFNGRDLAGWKVSKVNAEGVFVKDGMIVTNGKPAHLYYGDDGDAQIKDFEFMADVKSIGPSNSGIFIHTRYQDAGWPQHGYEAQICNGYKDPRKTASIYSFADIEESPAKDDVWFHYHIKVEGNRVRIWIDDKLAQDWTQPEDWPQKTKRFKSGTIALQAHDPGSTVLFKNLKLREINSND